LHFISTNRIDAMSTERLGAMRRAGFRVLGFGIESFSLGVLGEFNKAQIHRHIEPILSATLATGMIPFLDLILSSPHCTLDDIAETLREGYRWLRRGCEIGMYPYVIPFSGSALSQDGSLLPHTHFAQRQVAGINVAWEQPAKILPVDPVVKDAILRIEQRFEAMLAPLEQDGMHLPSRVRSLLWILASLPIMAGAGRPIADDNEVRAEFHARLPVSRLETVELAVETA